MSSLAAQLRLHTLEEYLPIERGALEKREFRDGGIVAMPSASPDHVLIATNLLAEIGNALRGKPCRVYSTDLKITAGKAD